MKLNSNTMLVFVKKTLTVKERLLSIEFFIIILRVSLADRASKKLKKYNNDRFIAP